VSRRPQPGDDVAGERDSPTVGLDVRYDGDIARHHFLDVRHLRRSADTAALIVICGERFSGFTSLRHVLSETGIGEPASLGGFEDEEVDALTGRPLHIEAALMM